MSTSSEVPSPATSPGWSSHGLSVRKLSLLTAAMQRVESQPELARRLGYEAARQAREEWSWERMVSAYEVLYERAWKHSAKQAGREGR